ncbi:MAG: 3'-5' exonuclease [Flavobacteriaceae bacterium]|nr:3'-5' exonuclease [Flavobacteriaceae bacterium]
MGSFITRFLKTQNKASVSKIVVLDTETTGLDVRIDRLLSIACITIEDNQILLADRFECLITQDYFNSKTAGIHGITKKGSESKISEKEALEKFIAYVADAILLGHHICFDIKMLNCALERNGLMKLRNPTLDTAYLFKKLKPLYTYDHKNEAVSLDALCHELNISGHGRHTAEGDAMLTALAFLKIKRKLFENRNPIWKRYFVKCR